MTAERLPVYGQWLNGLWYPGGVVRTVGTLSYLLYDDGAKGWLEAHQVQRQGAQPEAGSPPPGTRLVGLWSNQRWYPGRVVRGCGVLVYVHFDDHDEAWLDSARVRLVGRPSGPGVRVLARWSNGQWYLGAITQSEDARAYVEFDDGDKAWVRPDEFAVLSSTPSQGQAMTERPGERPGEYPREYQLVVARCRYCRTLTPVDDPRCRSCGAQDFT